MKESRTIGAWLSGVSYAGVLLSIAGVASADPLMNPPGTKMGSLGGAGTAALGNVSSLYHNPAAIVRHDFVWEDAEGNVQTHRELLASVEYRQNVVAHATRDGDYAGTRGWARDNQYMVGVTRLDPNFSYGLIYIPGVLEVEHEESEELKNHSMSSGEWRDEELNASMPDWHQQIDVALAGMGWDLAKRHKHGEGFALNVGAALGYASTSSGSTLDGGSDGEIDGTITDDDCSFGQGCRRPLKGLNEDEDTFYIVGLMTRIIDQSGFSLDLGASHRSKAEFNPEVQVQEGSFEDTPPIKDAFRVWGIPEETAAGFSANFQGARTFSLLGSYRTTSYEDVTRTSEYWALDSDPEQDPEPFGDRETLSLGGEISLRGGTISLRSGYYVSEEDAVNGRALDSTGYTLGVGFNDRGGGGGLSLELAFDVRDNEWTGGSGGAGRELYSSISVNWIL